ncbi:hypothetical protein FYK55_01195 [Roseiconus nitratireducens]|uniref:Uncharacterized protein n=1 Tax=Roseiconus nitratireducens TaxID=2605748 RepID=A0A5M6DHY4_9BACT|nr:hypothetical protein [Roseiconus nitratireducens]KAA5547063.1 hypothetical protein FYK55_01195 [Roseiconus nitratireducens]
MKRLTLRIAAPAVLFALVLALSATNVSAQSAGSWVDIGRGKVGAGANASGSMLQFAKSKSKSKNGVDFGHGFAVGAGPDGIALSNSIGVGGGPVGAAHNLQLNIGRNGTHVSHGGVVSEGGNRRVISGGSTGVRNGQVYGGSQSTGFGTNTKAYSKSHTRQFNNYGFPQQPTQVQSSQGQYFQGQSTYRGPRTQRNVIRMFHR